MNLRRLNQFCLLSVLFTTFTSTASRAAELIRLTSQTWDTYAVSGKEADCIYGDYVLRNESLVAVIANPIAGRHANTTVHDVGGCLIDLTRRDHQSDQLSAYYPGTAPFAFRSGRVGSGQRETLPPPDVSELEVRSNVVHFECSREAMPGQPHVTLMYSLADGQPYLMVESLLTNPHGKPIQVSLTDFIRADRSFEFGYDDLTHLSWAYDEWFRQAYGIMVANHEIKHVEDQKCGIRLQFLVGGKSEVTIPPGGAHKIQRKIFPAADLLSLKAIASRLTGNEVTAIPIQVVDAAGGVANAKVSVKQTSDDIYGSGRTDDEGKLRFQLPNRQYNVLITALGRPPKQLVLDPRKTSDLVVYLEEPGYVDSHITDEEGGPVSCKVEFRGREGTDDPFFGPDSAERGVHNLYYSHHGRFRQELGPGTYDVLISHGPEYDAVFTQIEVSRGRTTKLTATLKRTVDTTGWISADFHSHSSPSGDNTASQLGRVLNLICEHIEFAPCTEHNRISTYVPHLEQLQVRGLMATCTGIELTESQGDVNHQNAFPLILKPHTQDAGAPLPDANPFVQIERLALWDGNSDKLVQTNHPNIPKILGDRDGNGQYDGGFEQMFALMDVIEVHPPHYIFFPGSTDLSGRTVNNRIFNWLQLLNLGYRVPGVANTDAHYNFHGSGFVRNYLKSPTDDPSRIKTRDMVHSAEHGHLIMTNGPFLKVVLWDDPSEPKSGGTAGDNVLVRDGRAKLRVQVQCANWYDINRIQVYLNGHPSEDLNLIRRQKPQLFSNGVVKFDQVLPLEFKHDTHVIVVTAGEGLRMGAVMGPAHADDIPIAVSNPIFVDVEGDGFHANGDLLGVSLPVKRR